MVIVRIGNNIHFLWKIYNNNGSKYALSGNVRRLWLSSASLEKEIETYQIQYRNELAFTIDADDLTRYGTYKLVLQLKESDSQTEDATYDLTQLFQIVARTYPGACKESNGEVDVQVTSVLNNVVVERIEGLSAYEIAVNEGYVGSESEWLESLNGVGIASIDQTVIAVDDGSYNEVTFTLTNGETYTIRIRNGSKSAGVTRDDIIFALGYTPVTPAELAAKTDIFFATYNSTTWQEINEAVNSGKAVFLKKDEDIYPLVGDGGITPKLWEFAFVDTGLDHHRAVCHNDDTWQSATRGLASVVDLASKQDVISDLSAIRAGAALGATAYQKPSTGIPATDMASGVIPDISGKQDTLVSGSNIKTINGASILGPGNIEVQTEITMDNVPTSGSDNPVKSGGLYTALAAKQNNLTFDNTPVASSNNPVKSGGLYTVLAEKIGSQDIDNVVELTLAQYNALATKDARTMYIVSDSAIPSDHVGVASLVQTTTSTADGGINVWTCTLTNGQSFTLQVRNGNQGNSGYSGAAGELEVVNNLTQGGATAALSAEMGKTLEGEISQLGLKVDDRTSIKVGTTDQTILTNSANNTAYIWFQITPKLSHVDEIRFLAKSGTVTFYKVKAAGSTATITELQSVTNTSGEDKTVKEIAVNVDLGADEYIGVNGAFYYRSSGQAGYQSAYCNAAGTTIWWTGTGFACGFELVRYSKTIAEEYLNSKGGIYTIKKSGGDFTDIYSALRGTYGLDSATNPITLIVYPGSYETPTLAYSDFFATWLQKRYLSIIGTDKVNCILRNDNGYYNASSSGENLGDNSVIKINGNVYIANLTLISTDNDNESESSLLYHSSYCLHTDIDANENSILEIHNCRLINDHAPCIGFGIPKNCTLKLTDCELESTFFNPDVVNGGAVIFGHDKNGSTTQIEEHLVVKNCIIRSSNGHAVKFTNNNSSLADCVFVGNACALPSGKGISLGSTTTVIAPSFGNNIADMNAS